MTTSATMTPALTKRQRLARLPGLGRRGAAEPGDGAACLPCRHDLRDRTVALGEHGGDGRVGLIGPLVGAFLSARAGLGRFCTGAAFVIIATPMTSLPLLAIPAYVLAPWIAVAISEEPAPR